MPLLMKQFGPNGHIVQDEHGVGLLKHWTERFVFVFVCCLLMIALFAMDLFYTKEIWPLVFIHNKYSRQILIQYGP
jgi:hypothetical protein